jgi:hypothetical protein
MEALGPRGTDRPAALADFTVGDSISRGSVCSVGTSVSDRKLEYIPGRLRSRVSVAKSHAGRGFSTIPGIGLSRPQNNITAPADCPSENLLFPIQKYLLSGHILFLVFPIVIFVTPVATILKLQNANMGLTLYGNPKSTCTALVHVVIAVQGINYNLSLSIGSGEEKAIVLLI